MLQTGEIAQTKYKYKYKHLKTNNMKVKSLLLMAAVASMALAACSKSHGPEGDDGLKQVTVTLPNIAPISRATGDAINNNEAVGLENFKIFFLDAANTPVTIPTYNSTEQKVYFTSAELSGTNTYTYHFVPASAVKVVIVGNLGDIEYSAMPGELDVLNDNGTGNHPVYPLYGDSGLSRKNDATDGSGHPNVYTATVNLTPRTARFEIYGLEYVLDEGSTVYSFDEIQVSKIALSGYYTKYNYLTKVAAGAAVVAPAESSLKWGWIDAAVAPWANGLTDFTLGQGKRKFTNGDDATGYTGNGDNLLNIITFGLAETKVSAANNPSLYVSFFGKKAGSTDTPLYVEGRFTTAERFEAGKIYRVLFPIKDKVWENPERCIELTVEVAEWKVVPVTPEF